MQRAPAKDFSSKEAKPSLGGRKVTGVKHASAYDLVGEVQYLYVRIDKAKDLPKKNVSGCYVEVRHGDFVARTREFKKSSKSNPEWNEVFAIRRDRIQFLKELHVVVMDKDIRTDDLMDKDIRTEDLMPRVIIDLDSVPKRAPPESPVASTWHRLEGSQRGELMLAVWKGDQADEVFPEAWNSEWEGVIGNDVPNLRSNVYLFPKLWYLRVHIIEAQSLQPSDEGGSRKLFVKATLGNRVLRTMISHNPVWNKDLIFVVAEPIAEPPLILTIEDKVESDKDEVLGRCAIPLPHVYRRLDDKPVNTEWYNLEKHVIAEGDQGKKDTEFAGRIHVRICFEGGYQVLDESKHYSSDLRPATEPLWNSSIGELELEILNAQRLVPMKTQDGRGRTDAYCVAKYGQKWVRTRTILDSFEPKWYEQYSWVVFDPCTVITIGVFDNCNLNRRHKSGGGKDFRIGKVRIRLSTLETNRAYTHSYPLQVLLPSGMKKMCEIRLAFKFTCSSSLNMMHMYSQPLLPKMHYLHPLTVSDHEKFSSRHDATEVLSMRLSLDDPPLRKEVVEYMLYEGSQMWSMRRSKVNYSRIMGILGGLIDAGKWFVPICNWENPVKTVLIHILLIILIAYSGLILPVVFLSLFLIVVRNYFKRPRHPPDMDTRLSHAENVHPDELDEEFDTFPTSQPSDIVRMRYDRLRRNAGRLQTIFGDLATHGERIQSLLSFRDPRATAASVMFCLIASIVLWVTPFRVVVLLAGFYMLRHPRFRSKLPSVPLNFFRRLPARSDGLF